MKMLQDLCYYDTLSTAVLFPHGSGTREVRNIIDQSDKTKFKIGYAISEDLRASLYELNFFKDRLAFEYVLQDFR